MLQWGQRDGQHPILRCSMIDSNPIVCCKYLASGSFQTWTSQTTFENIQVGILIDFEGSFTFASAWLMMMIFRWRSCHSSYLSIRHFPPLIGCFWANLLMYNKNSLKMFVRTNPGLTLTSLSPAFMVEYRVIIHDDRPPCSFDPSAQIHNIIRASSTPRYLFPSRTCFDKTSPLFFFFFFAYTSLTGFLFSFFCAVTNRELSV